MKKLLILPYLLFIVITASAQLDISKKPAADWVNDYGFEDNKEDADGATKYLLIDYQDNLVAKSKFRHLVVKVLNSEGIQTASDITVDYDPAYQTLTFNILKIIRDGTTIDKLSSTEIKAIQRETSMDRNLYDGSLSAIINLSDVRKDDIIEYAYTINGFNPISKGNYTQRFYQQFTVAIDKIVSRIITKNKLNLKQFNAADPPETVILDNGLIEYVWNHNGSEVVLYDNNTPSWFDIQKHVSISSFDSWHDVAKWAAPLYKFQSEKIPSLLKSIKLSTSKDEMIIDLIRLVQDDIRYLGFESGISAYQPNEPTKVFHQRFGDCKDKSLLLTALLRAKGVDAHPFLVNTNAKGEIKEWLPSHTAFNHCIVNFNIEGKEYFVDPTLSNQGGDLDHFSFPDYGVGLVIDDQTEGLTEIPQNKVNKVEIHEVITVDEVGGSAGMTVTTRYYGSYADNMRTYFSSNSNEAITKEYLNFYSNLYPGIESTLDVDFNDLNRTTDNQVLIEESYFIEDFWEQVGDTEGQLQALIHPLVLESKINYTKSSGRTMPYYLGEPFVYHQTTDVYLPEDWNFGNHEKNISGNGFTYTNRTVGSGRVLNATYDYERTKEVIDAESVDAYFEKHDQLEDEMSYYLSYDQSFEGFKLSWISILLCIVGIGFAVFFYLKIYRNYDPDPWKYAMDTPIGSWLILLGLALTLSPIFLLKDVVTTIAYFNHNTWRALASQGLEATDSILFVASELLINIFLIGFSLLVVICFYQRRTSAPLLIIIFYAANLVIPIIDAVLADSIMDQNLAFDDESNRQSLRTLVALLIWGPYLWFSERAKNTFDKQYKPKTETKPTSVIH